MDAEDPGPRSIAGGRPHTAAPTLFGPNKGHLAALFIPFVSIFLSACATVAGPASPPASIAGFWIGATRTSCQSVAGMEPGRCGAVNRVTFAVEQNKEKLSGIYTCQFGNYVCRNLMESGNIVGGQITGRRVTLRVAFPDDGSSCIYSGMLNDGAIDGGFTCMQGGALVDEGYLHLKKAA
jgi:hypothetical protein